MPFSLLSLASDMAAVEAAAQAAVTDAELIYKFGAQMINAAETAYTAANNAGATKKAAVMAAIQSVVTSVGTVTWSTVEAGLSAWIDMVIAAWKAASSLFSSSVASATTQTASVQPA